MAVIKFTNDHIRINAHYTVKSIDLSLDGASALEQGKTTKKALKGDSTQATVTYTDGDKVTWLAKGDFSFDKDETVTITGVYHLLMLIYNFSC